MEKQRKLLVIANNCFSESSSNGRTLMYLLKKFDKVSIAQFFISGNPDFNFCDNYYKVSDKDALKSLFSFKKGNKNGIVKKDDILSNPQTDSNQTKKRKRCFQRYIRNVIWKCNRWWGKEFDNFIENFAPDAVLVFAGDASFMCDVARKIALKYSLPLYFYTTENYVIKDVIYNYASKWDIFHFFMKNSLNNSYEKLVEKCSDFIFNTDYIKELYEMKYNQIKRSHVFYVTSDMNDCNIAKEDNAYVYCGNLGVGRIKMLTKFAEILKTADSTAVLRAFGKILEEDDEEELSKHSNIEYMGVIPYSKVPENLAKSKCVIHCENDIYLDDLKGAFSTKIADCLACGKPFLVYASKEFPFVQYLEKYNACHIAANETELYEILLKFKENEEFRTQYIENAKKLAYENHNAENNAQKMFDLINKEG